MPRVTDTPGTWRESDGSAVSWGEAKAAWSAAGHPILAEIAAEYGAWVTYKDFAERIQQATRIRTRSLLPNWIGEVLGEVARTCAANSEPSLTSLVVHTDQTIGDGYVWALKELGRPVPDDLERAAAEDRLECYRYFGADIPPDARPVMTPLVAKARRRLSSANAQPSVCPTCHFRLPASGICDTCD